jgi:hypothetical protein
MVKTREEREAEERQREEEPAVFLGRSLHFNAACHHNNLTLTRLVATHNYHHSKKEKTTAKIT